MAAADWGHAYGLMLDLANRIEPVIREWRVQAQAYLESGASIPDWKLVDKRATRKWVKPDKSVERRLARMGLDKNQRMPRTLITPPAAEKLLKPLGKALPEDYVDAISSGTTLAPSTDPRQAAKPVGDVVASLATALSALRGEPEKQKWSSEMSNIALRGNFDITALNDLGTHLSHVQQAMSSASIEPFLRMDKGGKWIFGADSVEVEEGSHWAIHPLSVEHGYVCWNKLDTDRRSWGEAMVPFNQPKPVLSTLPEHSGSPWAEQIGFSMVCVTGRTPAPRRNTRRRRLAARQRSRTTCSPP